MKKIFLLLLIIFSASATVDAAKIDAYKEIILNRHFTIRYDNLTPAPRALLIVTLPNFTAKAA